MFKKVHIYTFYNLVATGDINDGDIFAAGLAQRSLERLSFN